MPDSEPFPAVGKGAVPSPLHSTPFDSRKMDSLFNIKLFILLFYEFSIEFLLSLPVVSCFVILFISINMKSGIRTSAFTINQGRFPRIVVSSIGVFNPISPLKQGDCVSLASKAMWDTGADFCCISQSLAKSLHLVSIGDSSRSTADGPVSCATYQVNLVLENGIYFEDVIVLEDPGLDEMGIDLLLGLAVINEVDFALTHDKKGNTVLSVSYPPSRTVDFRHR